MRDALTLLSLSVLAVAALSACDRDLQYGPRFDPVPVGDNNQEPDDEPRCGDGVCEGDETSSSCPADCGDGDFICGDGFCLDDETPRTCPRDCEAGPECGDGFCDDDESPRTCQVDCGREPVCGDGRCEGGENLDNCFDDCGSEAFCRDGICDDVERELGNCPEDCGEEAFCGDRICQDRERRQGTCPEDCADCGDMFCEPGEERTCPADCRVCGDGLCDGRENRESCPEDCARCGDGVCDRTESLNSCPRDCDNLDCGDGVCDIGENPYECMDCPYIECTPYVDDNGCDSDDYATCFPVEEDLGICLHSGSVPEGGACELINGSFFGDCVPGSVCIPETSETQGFCARLCEAWQDTSPGCAPGQVCGVLGATPYGACSDEVADPPLAPLDPCNQAGQWCDEGSICIEVDNQGNAACIALCRLNQGDADCPDMAAGQELFCEAVFQDDELGACIPQQ